MLLRHDTTKISIEKTVGEIHTCLATHGANAILSEYDDTGKVIALRCHISIGEQDIAFRLPSDWRPVPTRLAGDRQVPRGSRPQEQALPMSWRMIKDRVEAQMAIVDTKIVRLEHVLLPYAIMPDGRTLYERIRDARCV